MAGEVINDSPLWEVKMELERNVLRLIRNGESWRIAPEKEINDELFPARIDIREAKSFIRCSTYSSIKDENASSILPSEDFNDFESYETEFDCPDDPGLFDLVERSITLPIKKESRAKKDTRIFKCTICKKHYNGMKSFSRHKATHRTDRPHKCSVCNLAFKLKEDMRKHEKRHIERRIEPRKREKCEICCNVFHSRNNLLQHKLTHSNLRPFECDVCGNCFKRKFDLINHAKVHSDEKPFPCTQCERIFKYRKTLIKHQQISHSVLREVMETLRDKNELKSLKCEMCSKVFKSRRNLRQHKFNVCNVGPFTCSQCDRTFKRNKSLIKHQQKCGEKPWKGRRPRNGPVTRSSRIYADDVKPSLISMSLDKLSKPCYVRLERLSAKQLALLGIQSFSWATKITDFKIELADIKMEIC